MVNEFADSLFWAIDDLADKVVGKEVSIDSAGWKGTGKVTKVSVGAEGTLVYVQDDAHPDWPPQAWRVEDVVFP